MMIIKCHQTICSIYKKMHSKLVYSWFGYKHRQYFLFIADFLWSHLLSGSMRTATSIRGVCVCVWGGGGGGGYVRACVCVWFFFCMVFLWGFFSTRNINIKWNSVNSSNRCQNIEFRKQNFIHTKYLFPMKRAHLEGLNLG